MLTQMLTVCRAFIFLGVLPLVVGDGGFLANNFGHESLPFVISTFKDECPDHLNPLFWNYWNFPQYKSTDSKSSDFFKTKQINELTSENRTSENETLDENSTEEILLASPFVHPENHLYKRFIVFRRKNPVGRDYKRGPGFRSWGGKRNSISSKQNLEKKSKFVSWGGKRDEESRPNDLIESDPEARDALDKRPKFQNWGGKKSINEFLEEIENEIEKRPIWKDRFYLGESFKKHVPKRPHFQSWGGKRGLHPWRAFFGFFHSQPRFLLNGGEKRKFSSWGGKRYDNLEDIHWTKSSGENPKRHVFQNWGGKRTNFDLDVSDVFKIKELESREKIKQKNKRKMRANWEDRSNLNSSGDELKEEKNRR